MKRKCLAVAIILLFVGTGIIPSMAQDTEKPLPTSRGNWLYVGGSGPGNYTRIQDAINDASDGDTVFVYEDSSPYYEHNIIIDKAINLIGQEHTTTIIDGNYSDGDIIIVSADWVNISGFTIQNSGDWQTYAGIDISSNYNTITGNIILNNGDGIELHQSHDNTINENTISSNNEAGLDIASSNNNTFSMNNILQNGDCGILVFNSNLNTIHS